MFQPWRIKLRQVEEAVKANRLDEACVMLRQENLEEYRPAKKIMADLGKRLAERGRDELKRGESLAGWRDLETAQQMGVDDGLIAPLREELVDHALAQAEKCLAAGDARAALERLDALQKHSHHTSKIRDLQQVARKLARARDYCREGRYRDAERLYAAAKALRPDLELLEEHRQDAEDKERMLREAREDLHRAMAAQDWTAVVTASEGVLELAPVDPIATDARSKAWKSVGAKVPSFAGLSPVRNAEETKAGRGGETVDTDIAPGSPKFVLWVDGVGGYLVCQGDDLMIGQPSVGRRVDIPILGDLSHRHASIRRSGDGYLLIPHSEARLNGKTITEATPLVDRVLIELGSGVRMMFRQPHPYSATARLELVSGNRTQPAADGVLLMADTLVCGADQSSHVTCRDLESDVVLFERNGELYCRHDQPLVVNGQPYDGETPIARSSQISSELFSMSLEDLNPS